MPALHLPRLTRIRVVGNSMSPAFNEGDWLLFSVIHPNRPNRRIRPGAVVLVQRDERDFLQVKRVNELLPDGTIWVEGDNRSASTDSRTWGALRTEQIKGVLRLRYKRAR